MLVGILKKLVGIMIGPVGILKNACRYFETVGIMNVGIMNVGIMNVGIMNATRFLGQDFTRKRENWNDGKFAIKQRDFF